MSDLSIAPQSCIGIHLIQETPLNPVAADIAPADPMRTVYDEQHLPTYLPLLDADADGTDWRKITVTVLRIDPGQEPNRACKAFESHLARVKWMTEYGYRQLLRGASN